MNAVIIQSIISYVGIPDGDVEVVEDTSVITPGLPLPPFFRYVSFELLFFFLLPSLESVTGNREWRHET